MVDIVTTFPDFATSPDSLDVTLDVLDASDLIEELRDRRGLTFDALGNLCRASYGTVRAWPKEGRRVMPRHLYLLANALQVRVAVIARAQGDLPLADLLVLRRATLDYAAASASV